MTQQTPAKPTELDADHLRGYKELKEPWKLSQDRWKAERRPRCQKAGSKTQLGPTLSPQPREQQRTSSAEKKWKK